MTLSLTAENVYLFVTFSLMALQMYQFRVLFSLKRDVDAIFQQMANMIVADIIKKAQEKKAEEEKKTADS